MFHNKPKVAYSHDAFTRDQQETRERDKTRVRLERDQRKTRERLEKDKEKLERYGTMEDGLSQSNKVAGESQRELETRERGREEI